MSKQISTKFKFHSQYQIEQRKRLADYRRQQEIELAKIEIERIKRDEKLLAEANEHLKRAKNCEMLQFNDYMHRVRADQEIIQMDRTDWKQMQRASDQLETNAEMERRNQRQLLNTEQRVSEKKPM